MLTPIEEIEQEMERVKLIPPASTTLVMDSGRSASFSPTSGDDAHERISAFAKSCHEAGLLAPSQAIDFSTVHGCLDERAVFMIAYFWADVEFWKLVWSAEEDVELLEYVNRRHFRAREIPSRMEFQAMTQPGSSEQRRAFFFGLFFQNDEECEADCPKPEVVRELEAKHHAKLWDLFLVGPQFQSRVGDVAAQCFTEEVLKHLEASARRLAEDAKWCLENPDIFPVEAERRFEGKRGVKVNRDSLLAVEKMVLRLIENPNLTNVDLGRRDDGERDPSREELAKRARNLAEHRHRVSVRHYTTTIEEAGKLRTIGKTPTRRDKGKKEV